MARKLNQLWNRPLIYGYPSFQRGRLSLRISRSTWLYQAMIMLSIIVASLVTFVFSQVVLRPFLVMWFLFVCPGMTVVRFFQLNDVVIEWLLALALSIAIDAFVAGLLLYTGRWSPLHIFIILIVFCLIANIPVLLYICRIL